MDKAIQKKWVKALRSGEFKQGVEALSKDGKFCCLGVGACILAGRKLDGRSIRKYKHEEGHEYLKNTVLDTIGLSEDNQSMLADLNDSGATFHEISYCIENL